MKRYQSLFNHKSKGIQTLVLLSLSTLTACGASQMSDSTLTTETPVSTVTTSNQADETILTDAKANITFDQTTIRVEGSGATVSNQTVEITSGGTYYFSGTLTDGQIIVNSQDEEDVYLVLDGINLTSSTSAPIHIKNAKNTIIVLQEGSENIITDNDSYVLEDSSSDEPNATIFSKDDLKIKGSGSLIVNANYHHGIVSKDDLEIKNGIITINSVADGIKGKDSVTIENGNVTIIAGGDGIQSHNSTDSTKGYVNIEGGTITITANLDGIQAETNLTINDGLLSIHAGGGSENASSKQSTGTRMWGQWGQSSSTETSDSSSSAKGLKAGVLITLNGGNVTIDSSDDSIHSNDSIIVNEGTYTLSSGDDGVHADTDLEINGGTLELLKSYEGLESSNIIINDGIISIVASDDGINVAGGNDSSALGGRPGQNQFSASTGSLNINGGYVYVDASGDGLDANGSMTMSDGIVIVNGPTNSANGSLDYDSTFNITGGTLIAVGGSGMAQTPSLTSSQPILNIRVSSLEANALINVTDSNGNEILTFSPAKTVQSIIISTPDLELNETYTVSTGGLSTGTPQDGLYSGGSYSNGTEIGTMTLSSVITSLGQSGGMNGQNFGGEMRGGAGAKGSSPINRGNSRP